MAAKKSESRFGASLKLQAAHAAEREGARRESGAYCTLLPNTLIQSNVQQSANHNLVVSLLDLTHAGAGKAAALCQAASPGLQGHREAVLGSR